MTDNEHGITMLKKERKKKKKKEKRKKRKATNDFA